MRKGTKTHQEHPDGNTQIPLDVSAFRLSMLHGSVAIEPKTRLPNSALNSQAVAIPEKAPTLFPRIDWFTVIFDTDKPSQCVDIIEQILAINFDKFQVNLNARENGNWSTVRGTSGSTLSFKVCAAGNITTRLELPGSISGSLQESTWRALWDYTSVQPNHRCTRIDYNVDDTTYTLGLGVIELALREGNYAGYRGGEVYESIGGDRAGKTVYFGSRRSMQRVRFYDKEAESGGEIKAIRYEVQCRSARADELYNLLRNTEEGTLWKVIRGRLRTAISFISRKDKNLSRSRAAGFWTDFIVLLDSPAIAQPPITRKSTISRTMAWAEKTLPKVLMKVQESLGSIGFGEWLELLKTKASYKVKESELSDVLTWIANNDSFEYINELKLKVEMEIRKTTGEAYGGFDYNQTIYCG